MVFEAKRKTISGASTIARSWHSA